MDTTVNFKGAFLIQKPSKAVKKAVGSKLGKQPKVFENFTNNGDILYVTEKSADKAIAQVLMRYKKTGFKYYPQLSTKSGFDTKFYNDAMNILSNYKSKIITNLSELKKVLKIHRTSLGFSTKKRDNTLEKSLETLNLNINDCKIKKLDGFNEIYAKDGELIALISEPGQYGWRYARVEPQAPNDEIKRYAVRGNHKFAYINSPDEKIENGTSAFLIKYYESVNMNRKSIHNAKHQ